MPVIVPRITEMTATQSATRKLIDTEWRSVSSSHAARYQEVVAPVKVDDCRPTAPSLNE